MMLIRVAGAILTVLYEWSLYFLSFLGPVLWLYRNRFAPAPALLAIALLGYIWAGVTFLVLLIVTKRLFFPRVPSGHVKATSKAASIWFLAVSLMRILDRSPFHAFIEINVIAPWFYRGMGASIPASASFGTRALVSEPWFLRMGKNVSVGGQAMIQGHIAIGEELILGQVSVGDHVVIGMRSVIFPEVHIGNRVRIAAGAVVTRGTVIPDGETWGGVPARRLKPAGNPSLQTGCTAIDRALN